MVFAFGETVTILRPTTVLDRNENEIPGLDDETDVPGCGVGPRFSEEPEVVGRQQVVVGLSVFMPAGTDVRPTDRLRVRGVVREVEGEPFDYKSPFTGWRPGVVVNVKGVSG